MKTKSSLKCFNCKILKYPRKFCWRLQRQTGQTLVKTRKIDNVPQTNFFFFFLFPFLTCFYFYSKTTILLSNTVLNSVLFPVVFLTNFGSILPMCYYVSFSLFVICYLFRVEISVYDFLDLLLFLWFASCASPGYPAQLQSLNISPNVICFLFFAFCFRFVLQFPV